MPARTARTNNIMLENTRMIFRNFSGKGSTYNREGDRNFGVIIKDDTIAEELLREGWNVKILEPRDEGDNRTAYIKVAVSFRVAPPKIFVINGKSKTELNEDTIGELDYADVSSVDVILSPYRWEVNGKEGIKAYLKTIYVVLNEDPFADKYLTEPVNMDDDDLPF